MNIKKTIGISNDFWNVTADSGMAGIVAENVGAGRYAARADGHEFLNMSSYSYLGLDSHPALIRAAADAVTQNASLNTSVSRMRVHFGILKDAEDALSDLFRVEAVTLASCAAAAWSALPLVASGAFTDGVPPLMSAGYYTSALFFPVIARGKARLRIMLRADMTRTDIENFGRPVNELRSQND